MSANGDHGQDRGERLLAQVTSLVLSLQFAFLSPSLALFLSASLGAGEGQVGLVLALFNASGFLANLVIPILADRRNEYLKVMMACGVSAIAMAGALYLVTSLPLAAIVLVTLGGPAGVGGSLLFAHLNSADFGVQAVMGARAMMSVAWVAGPPLAMLLARVAGVRSVLGAMVVTSVAGIVLVAAMRRRRGAMEAGSRTRKDKESAEGLPISRLVMVVVAFVFFGAANSAMTSTMTIFTVNSLGLDVVWGGVALAVAAAIEVPFLLLLGRLSSRFTPIQLLVTGGVSGILFFASMTMVNGVPALLAVQLFNAWFVASVNGVGLTWFMDIIPRPGLASGLFSNAYRVGAITAGGIIAVAGTSVGYQGMFVVCAAVITVAVIIVLVAGGRSRRSSRS